MTTADGCDCKIGRVIESYELSGIDGELARDRRGDTGPPASLRDLAERFNREVLRQAVEDAGGMPIDVEVTNVYRLLIDDDVSRGRRIRVRKRLEGLGVDLEAVERAFVSHPTMGAHLSDCLGVERPAADGDRTERVKERVFKLESRGEAVIRNALAGLASSDHVAAGDLTVTMDARVTCETCGVHAPAGEFVDRRGCDCPQTPE